MFAFAQDFTVFGGSLSETNAAKIVKIMDLAMKLGAPIVGLNDSGGARIQEGVLSLGGYADIFLRNTLASGRGAADFGDHGARAPAAPSTRRRSPTSSSWSRTPSYMFVTGPDVIKTVTHEDVTKEELGGAMTHNATSGVAHFAVDDDRECLALIRELLRSCPATTSTIRRAGRPTIRRIAKTPALDSHRAGRRPTSPTTCSTSSTPIVDDGDFLEVHQHYARNILVGFARLDGRPVGIVANQPAVLAGTLDIDASVKGARFVRFCDAFNIPLVTFEDVPGLPARARCRNTAASSSTARSCCSPSPRRRCRR